MKVKKFLKKQAKKDLQSIETDNDREFLQNLINLVEKQNQDRKKKKPAKQKRNGG